jgi:phage-related protein
MQHYGFTISVKDGSTAEMKKIEAELEKLGIKATVETKKVTGAFAGMKEKIGGHLSEIRNLFLGGLGIGAAFAGVELIEKSKEHYNKLQAAAADLRGTIESMGNAAGVSYEQMMDIAEAIDKTSVYEKSAIIGAEGMLATFGHIRGDMFKDVMQSVADMSKKFFGGDMQLAAKQIGIAFNDPVKGAQRLRREGVTLDEQDIQRIKNLVKQGKLLEAQKILLGELKREGSKQSAIFAATDEGKIQLAKKAWDDVYERVGAIVMKIELAMIPVMKAVIGVVEKIVSIFDSTSKKAEVFRYVLVAIAAVLTGYGVVIAAVTVATKLWTAAQWLLDAAMDANPIGIVITLIVAMTAAIMMLWDKMEGFRKVVGGVFGFMLEMSASVLHAFMNLSQTLVDLFTGHVFKAFQDAKEGLKQFKNDFTTGMKDAISSGASAAVKSEFKFGDLLKFGTGQKGVTDGLGGKDGKHGTGVKDNAINTSNLAGAKGGLGEAKVINIHIDTMQKVTTSDNKQLKERGQDAVEVMLRALNNIAFSQSGTQ